MPNSFIGLIVLSNVNFFIFYFIVGEFMKLLSVGYGNFVSMQKVVSIVSPDSAPIKRLIQEVRERGMLIDATCGRRTRAVIVTTSGHVILSAVQTETVCSRVDSKQLELEEEE